MPSRAAISAWHTSPASPHTPIVPTPWRSSSSGSMSTLTIVLPSSTPQNISAHPSREPIAITTSASFQRLCPIARWANSGWAVGIVPCPMRRVVTGAWSSSASCAITAPASWAPPPTTINGRSASRSAPAARSMPVWSIGGVAGAGALSDPGASVRHRLTGTSRPTGRGRPDTSASTADCSCLVAESPSSSSSACLVSWLRIACWSTSSCSTPKARPRADVGISPTIARLRAFDQYPLVSAAPALSMPGPGTTQNAAGVPATSEAPFAMYAAPCSWRLTTRRMSGASTRGSEKSAFCTPGRQKSVSMPVTLSASTTCWAIVGGAGFSLFGSLIRRSILLSAPHLCQRPHFGQLAFVELFERRPGGDVLVQLGGRAGTEQHGRQRRVLEGVGEGDVGRRGAPLGGERRHTRCHRQAAVVHATRFAAVVAAHERAAGEHVAGDETDRAALERTMHLRVARPGVVDETRCHLRRARPRRAGAVANVERRVMLGGRPHPRAPRPSPPGLDQPRHLVDQQLHREPFGRMDGVDQVDVVEPHARERCAELVLCRLLRPELPPQLVRDDHLVALPSGGAEQLAEHDLGVAGRNRCPPGLVVVTRVVEHRDPSFAGGAHDLQTLLARDPFVRPPRPQRHHRNVEIGSAEWS